MFLHKSKSWLALLSFLLCVLFSTNAHALPSNFQDKVIWSGLDNPTAISFAPNGKIFIAEKSGIIKVFDNLQDTTPTVFADLRTEVLDYSDRGLLGLTVDPQFPTRPYVYAFYSLDALPGGTPPYYNDNCPNPDYCPAGSRLVKITASGNVMSSKQILMENWCDVESSHSVGMLTFGADGALYLSHGDGASYNYVDYGQDGGCPDPANEGGALRSQDLRTTGDPVGYDGTLLRINPDTGLAFAGNPLAGGTNTQDDPIIAYGFRNPFRYTIDPLTGAIWVADVGWGAWEEINYLSSATAGVNDFGWPCYEGFGRQPGYDAANLPICENLYTASVARDPHYAYSHVNGSGAITGIALYRGNNFPSTYNGAIFFGDYTQGWIRVMLPGANGLPDTTKISDFISTGVFPVDIKVGPDGSLYYVDIVNQNVHQVSFFNANTPPTAKAEALPNSGSLPLLVHFDASGSFDPDAGDTLGYEWDLDGDGAFDDSTVIAPSYNYTTAQMVPVKVRVTDSHGASSIASVNVFPGNRPPVVSILSPSPGDTYVVGEELYLTGEATDPDVTGALPASAFSWDILLYHCALSDPNECHTHNIQTQTGIKDGFTIAPDHEFPSRLEFRLTVEDPTNPLLTSTKSVTIEPKTTTWTFTSTPPGLQLSVYGASGTTPFTREVIVNAQTNISAPTLQQLGANSYEFSSWSDGGASTHGVTAGLSPQTFNAIYVNKGQTTSVWHSWEVTTQSGSPQGIVISNTNIAAQMEFYESTDDLGINKNGLLGFFDPGVHQRTFNNVEKYWSKISGLDAYPYVGKSTVDRGQDEGETNAPAPLGVRDLQLHPPGDSDHNIIAAFKVPQDGTYKIYDIGIRRVFYNGNDTRLHVFRPDGAELLSLNATNNRQWVTAPDILTLSNLKAGEYIYFGVDRYGDYSWDAAEISWSISVSLSNPAPQPTCSLGSNPSTINQGQNSSLSWTTTNATGFSIDQGVGAQSSIGSGSLSVSPLTTTTYNGAATGPGGSATCSATVTVVKTPTCSLTVNPTSITQGSSATLSWTTQNATSLSIDQGIGSATPVASGSRSVTPNSTTTYKGTVTGAGGTATCSAILTVNPLSSSLIWNSWNVKTQSGSPQGVVISASGNVTASLEFYESTNNYGVNKTALLPFFNSGTHPVSFNHVSAYWSGVSGTNAYPYVGKSTVKRGSDAGESNTPSPTGVLDLQLYPPSNNHNIVVAFKVPQDGTYTISNLAVRRVSNLGNNARLRVFNPQKVELINLTAIYNRDWVKTAQTFTLANLTAGQYIYFGVDRYDDNSHDAAEISWTITKN